MITIGIVLYNEEKHMPLLWSNLRVLNSFYPKVSVIVVNNASTDTTLQSLESIKLQYPITLIQRTENNLGCARQDVVNASSSEWVGFIDGDCGITEEWVQGVLERIPHLPPYVAAFGGPWFPAGDWAEDYKALFRSPMGNFSLPQLSMRDGVRVVQHIPTANVIYRKADVLRAGGFLPQFIFVGEDLDLSCRLHMQGQKMWMYGGLPISHYLPSSYEQWAKKIFNYGRGRVQVAGKNSQIFEYVLLLPIFFIVLFMFSLSQGEWRFVLAYLVAVASCSLIYSQRAHVLRVCLLTMITHFSYALGMAYEWWKQLQKFFYKQMPTGQHQETSKAVGKISGFVMDTHEKN